MAQHTIWLSIAVEKQWLWSQLVIFPEKQHSLGKIMVNCVVFDRELSHSSLTNVNDCVKPACRIICLVTQLDS